jgi:flagellar basal body-associated protein FliL
MNLIEQILNIYLITIILLLIVAVFVTGFIFFFRLYKQIKELKKNDKW